MIDQFKCSACGQAIEAGEESIVEGAGEPNERFFHDVCPKPDPAIHHPVTIPLTDTDISAWVRSVKATFDV